MKQRARRKLAFQARSASAAKIASPVTARELARLQQIVREHQVLFDKLAAD